ncbi:MAG: outer membrane protein assembly factor BamC [Gammaproteobacteria bacterium]|nr:outer membrane protein assembly factor BamC [Gammaproteobacteria bacterium]
MNRLILLVLAAVFVTACSSDGEERPEYLDSQSLSALEIPPQLTRPDNSEELKIPQPSAKALASLQKGGVMEGTVAPAFKGLALKSDQGIYWLEVDQDADTLWVTLRDFWANEGIAIERDEPLLGLMETQWLKEYRIKADRDAGFFKRVLSRLSPDMMDRFRMRVERTGKQARIFVSHRGLQIGITGETSRWMMRESDHALEKEILYRLTLFAGLNTQQADELFLAYTPYQTRISPVAGSENSFEIIGRRELAWKRLQQAVDQLGATVVQTQPKQGTMLIELSEIPQALLKEETATIDDSGLEGAYEQTSTPRSTTVATPASETAVKLMLTLQEKTTTTLLQVTDEAGKPITGGFAYDAMQMLANLLK